VCVCVCVCVCVYVCPCMCMHIRKRNNTDIHLYTNAVAANYMMESNLHGMNLKILGLHKFEDDMPYNLTMTFYGSCTHFNI
jgi:hypothetical protein